MAEAVQMDRTLREGLLAV